MEWKKEGFPKKTLFFCLVEIYYQTCGGNRVKTKIYLFFGSFFKTVCFCEKLLGFASLASHYLITNFSTKTKCNGTNWHNLSVTKIAENAVWEKE